LLRVGIETTGVSHIKIVAHLFRWRILIFWT